MLADRALLTSFLTDMGLNTFRPLLEALPHGFVDGSSGRVDASRDLRRFLIQVARPVAANAHLVQVLETARDATFGASDEEVHRLVHYSLLLHLITRALAADPALAAETYARQKRAVRAQEGWWPFDNLSLFEYVKLCTVARTLETFIRHRSDGLPLRPTFGDIGCAAPPLPSQSITHMPLRRPPRPAPPASLPINILEAVLHDASHGRYLNACAGLPLMLARPGRSGANGAAASSDHRRAIRMHLPEASEWKSLYVSWNLAFTSTSVERCRPSPAPEMTTVTTTRQVPCGSGCMLASVSLSPPNEL